MIRRAAVSFVRWCEGDPRFLCVWNKRYLGWSLPGGLVEDGESAEQAQRRELKEETGLDTLSARIIYEGPHGLHAKVAPRPGRASEVVVFEVEALGHAREMEPGCPISWMTREEFLAASPFFPFYARLFETGVLR